MGSNSYNCMSGFRAPRSGFKMSDKEQNHYGYQVDEYNEYYGQTRAGYESHNRQNYSADHSGDFGEYDESGYYDES